MGLKRGERQLIERAGLEYPERFARVRKACRFGAFGVSLDVHAARVVLAIESIREGQHGQAG